MLKYFGLLVLLLSCQAIDQKPNVAIEQDVVMVENSMAHVVTNIYYHTFTSDLKWTCNARVRVPKIEDERARQYALALPQRNRIFYNIQNGIEVPDVKPLELYVGFESRGNEHPSTYEHQQNCLNCSRVANLTQLSIPFDRDSLVAAKRADLKRRMARVK